MAKSKVGSTVIVQRSIWSSDANRKIEIGEKGTVVDVKDPHPILENCGKMLVILIQERIISLPESYVRFVNFKLQKSEKNLEKSKEKVKTRKQKRREEKESNEKAKNSL
jgi:hypothetical protein